MLLGNRPFAHAYSPPPISHHFHHILRDEGSSEANPLNNLFINFLLQYRTIRIPLEVMLQSVPQTCLAAYMYYYIQVR